MNEKNLDDWAISKEMFTWILNNIPEGSTILEFGSGTGTIELTKHYTVYSVEQDSQWVGKAEKSNYIHAPIANRWYDDNIVFNNIPKDYDLIIVDGPRGPEYRSGIDKHWDKLNTNVPIILDDSHRESDKNHAVNVANMLNKELKEIHGWQKNFIILYEK